METNPAVIAGLYAAGLILSGLLFARGLNGIRNGRRCALLSVLIGLPAAAVLAKILFLIHNLGLDARNWSAEELFQLRWEDLSFTGGCIGFSIGVRAAARLTGIPGGKALDAFAVPGCLLIAFARMAESCMGTVGQGDMPSFLPAVFPFAVKNGWGIPNLAVFTLEALAALLCGGWLLLTRKRKEATGNA